MFSIFFFFFKQKPAYELRISDWSSDVCSSDLRERLVGRTGGGERRDRGRRRARPEGGYGHAGGRDRGARLSRHQPRDDERRADRRTVDDPAGGGAMMAESLLPGEAPVSLKDRKSTRLNSSH